MTGRPHWAAKSAAFGLLVLSALAHVVTTDSMYLSILMASLLSMCSCRRLSHVLTVPWLPLVSELVASGLELLEHTRASCGVGYFGVGVGAGAADSMLCLAFLDGLSGMEGDGFLSSAGAVAAWVLASCCSKKAIFSAWVVLESLTLC